ANSCAGDVVGSSPSLEDLEDRFTVLARDAGTAVVDSDHDAAPPPPDPHVDRRSDGRVAHSIHDQVVDDAFDLGRIDTGLRELGAECDGVPLVAMSRHYLLDEGRNVGLGEPRADEAVSQAVEVEKVGEKV